eukprot:6066196-Amphidinium_carterae.1
MMHRSSAACNSTRSWTSTSSETLSAGPWQGFRRRSEDVAQEPVRVESFTDASAVVVCRVLLSCMHPSNMRFSWGYSLSLRSSFRPVVATAFFRCVDCMHCSLSLIHI